MATRSDANSNQSARWCFTINNYENHHISALDALDCKYIIYGKEVGASGTPHLQGFVIFDSRVRFNTVKKMYAFLTAHLEIARGTSEQAAEYCRKDGLFVERGVLPAPPGKAGGEAEQERWKRARDAAQAGELDSIPDDIYIRYYRTLKEIKKDHLVVPEDASDVTGVWIYGPPGVGKSRKARVDYPDAYLKMQNKWWDGYQGEKFVILDDFDSKELGHLLKIWADRYAFLAETKGGAICIRPDKFVITSNYSIDELFVEPVLCSAIRRRFQVIHMAATGIFPPAPAPPPAFF